MKQSTDTTARMRHRDPGAGIKIWLSKNAVDYGMLPCVGGVLQDEMACIRKVITQYLLEQYPGVRIADKLHDGWKSLSSRTDELEDDIMEDLMDFCGYGLPLKLGALCRGCSRNPKCADEYDARRRKGR